LIACWKKANVCGKEPAMPSTILDSAVFRDIFTTQNMRAVWSDENRVQKYLDFEAALARAQAKLRIIPKNAAAEIVRHCHAKKIDMALLKEKTEKVGYPVLPVVQQLIARCKGGLGEWAHWGATTQDVTDTATVLQIREALDLIERDIAGCADALAKLAKMHRDTVMVGRSNLQQAVPITFGYKMATVLAAFERHRERLAQMRKRVEVGEFGGAAGTLSSLGKDGLRVQAALMNELKLGQPDISWHTVRDRIAEVGGFLALVTGTCGKIAFDVKLLMQTEVEEVMEPYHAGREEENFGHGDPLDFPWAGRALVVLDLRFEQSGDELLHNCGLCGDVDRRDRVALLRHCR
jgi:3-carboxy-cis,cis-muconate cycloisomerase